jgi:hypothetical protein
MRKNHHAAARELLPNLFDLPVKIPHPPPEVAAELIPQLERLLLAAEWDSAAQTPEPRRDARER